MHHLKLPQKGFCQKKWIKIWGWSNLVGQSMALLPLLFTHHDLWLLHLLNYAAICSNVISSIWRNPYRDIEINRNWRSEELMKLGGGKKIFIFRGNCHTGGGGEGGGGILESFHFPGGKGGWGDCPMRFIPLCILW